MSVQVATKDSVKYQPFVKWAGGKRGLLSQILPLFPNQFNNYLEPFVGGGAVFFELFSKGILNDKKIYLFDINSELINTYYVIKSDPKKLIDKLENFAKNHTKEFYYKVREWDRKDNFNDLDPVTKAARFIYLNKTCFNGLYRVNKKGYFNTPIGSYKNPNICDTQTILANSFALKNTIIQNSSFENVIKFAKKGDLVYLDPPYYPLNKTSNFTSYSEFEFLEDKQQKLFDIFYQLDKKGCLVVQSNSDTNFIKNLYANYDIQIVNANRFINSKSSGRGKISEVVIRNFE